MPCFCCWHSVLSKTSGPPLQHLRKGLFCQADSCVIHGSSCDTSTKIEAAPFVLQHNFPAVGLKCAYTGAEYIERYHRRRRKHYTHQLQQHTASQALVICTNNHPLCSLFHLHCFCPWDPTGVYRNILSLGT